MVKLPQVLRQESTDVPADSTIFLGGKFPRTKIDDIIGSTPDIQKQACFRPGNRDRIVGADTTILKILIGPKEEWCCTADGNTESMC